MNNTVYSKRIQLAIVALVILGIGFAAGWAIRETLLPSQTTSVREKSTDYKFIAPLLFVKTPEEDAFPQYRPLKDSLVTFADRAMREERVKDISIYFRNLNTSQWVGVNVEKRFSPSSMLKVVTLIATLREVEKNPVLLKSTVTIPSADKLPQINQSDYGPQNPLVSGDTYTIEKIIENLIVESDNTADYVLRSVIGDDNIRMIYDDLELPRPETSGGYTPQEYSRLFRTLYNATYLSHNLSEQVLDLLSRTNFNNGIVAGIPKDTTVAHKFGLRSIVESNGIIDRELHDCGIIYFEKYPYFLCVMTRGENFSELGTVIGEASQLAWQEFSKLH